jgi:hypothetical protein
MLRTMSTKTLKKRRPGSRPLGEIVRTTDNQFLDFLRRCLQFVYLRNKLRNDCIEYLDGIQWNV